ncbi:transcriptional repressor TCF25-domain-containing protein [Flagelloscypha sp. PMI_526]|nr:transcriptional repressor TCF25-domain-containing protein [Flagelloscypha sp. PMI_526]
MPPRLNKRQQRELEELSALNHATPGSDEDESPIEEAPVVKRVAGFATLLDGDDEDDDVEDTQDDRSQPKKSKAKKSKKRKKKVEPAPTDIPPTPPADQIQSKSEKKAAKKAAQKAKARAKDLEGDEIDKALAELALKNPSLIQQPAGASTSSNSETTAFFKHLSLESSFLDPAAELRKFFGSRVVSSASQGSSSAAGKRSVTQKSLLTKPHPTWYQIKGRDGLGLTAFESKEHLYPEEKYWTIGYTPKYKAVTRNFLRTVASGDPNGFYALLREHPWHVDTLLQMAEVYRHREEHTPAADNTSRAIFAYERAFVGTGFSFSSGSHRLAFSRVENRVFFLALSRMGIDLLTRGTPRTSFEHFRLLWSLDPWTDPHGTLFWLDVVGVRGGMRKWLLEVYDIFEKRDNKDRTEMDPSKLPGYNYSRALAVFLDEEGRKAGHEKSSELLKVAFRTYPTVLPLLADKIEVRVPGSLQSLDAYRVVLDASALPSEESAILHLLSHMYAHRAVGIWKTPEIVSWFQTSLMEFATSPSPGLATADAPTLDLFKSKPTSFFSKTSGPDLKERLRWSVYRHVLTSPPSTIPSHLKAFVPQHVVSQLGVSADPLPPRPTHMADPESEGSWYNEAFFSAVPADAEYAEFAAFRQRRRPPTRRQREAEERAVAAIIPDRAQRAEIVGLHARLAANMGAMGVGVGLLQFAQMIQENPEMVAEVVAALEGGQVLRDGGEMPGGFDGALEDDNEPEDGGLEVRFRDVNEPIPEGAAVGESDDEDSDEDGEEDEEDEYPMPVRLFRNVLGRFFGTAGTSHDDVEYETEDEGDVANVRDLDGVD